MSPAVLLYEMDTITENSHSMQEKHKCTTCGIDGGAIRRTAEKRIKELEAQVRILSDKATSAADKLADYEDEIDTLKKHTHTLSNTSVTSLPSVSPTPAQVSRASTPTTAATTAANRISSFLTLSRPVAAPPPPPPLDFYTAALENEKSLRLTAEGRLAEVTAELEDLTSSLFQSANEMVAEERKERARLEERVKVLEKREAERGATLGLLERAVERIGRVRDVLEGKS